MSIIFVSADTWIDELRNNSGYDPLPIIILVGNKLDQSVKRCSIDFHVEIFVLTAYNTNKLIVNTNVSNADV